VQTKVSVEIECRLDVSCRRFRNGDRWPQVIVGAFSKWHYHVQAINRSALEDSNQGLAPAAGYALTSLSKHCALEK